MVLGPSTSRGSRTRKDLVLNEGMEPCSSLVLEMVGHMGFDKYLRYSYASRQVADLRSVLDVGGGTGDFFERHRIEGIVAEMGADKALFRNAKTHHDLVRYDGSTLPFGGSSFQGVVCLDVLEHVPPELRAGFLSELRRVSGGVVVLTCPADRQYLFRAFLAVAKILRLIGYSEVMERSLLEHAANGIPTSTEVIDDFRSAGWQVDERRIFGRMSALFLLSQHLFPPLALEPVNRLLDPFVQRFDVGPASYLLLTARRQAK